MPDIKNIKIYEDTLTTREAAALLNASLRTIQLWVEAGQLKAWKTPGGHRRILRTAVDAMIAERQAVSSGSGKHVQIDATREDMAMLDALVQKGYATNTASAYRRALREAHGRLGGGG